MVVEVERHETEANMPVVAQAEALCHSRLFKLLKVTFTVSARPSLDHLANSKIDVQIQQPAQGTRAARSSSGLLGAKLEGRSSSLLRYRHIHDAKQSVAYP